MAEPMKTFDQELLRRVQLNTAIMVKESSRLLSQLHVDSAERLHFRLPYDQSTAKRYFMSRCLMDVQGAVGAHLRLMDHLQYKREKNRSDGEGDRDVIVDSILAEQNLWRRRLGEGLARLVLFATSDTDAHYYHYLLLSEVEESRREVANLEKDFGAKSSTLERRLANLRTQAVALSVAFPNWYTPDGKKVRPADQIIREAIKNAVAQERTALAYSYQHGFAEPSGVIHFSTSAANYRLATEQLLFNLTSLLLLSVSITTRIGSLAGLATAVPLNPGKASTLAELPEVGEFVIVILDHETTYLAEVIEVVPATTIVARVKVRFLGTPPYSDIVEDDFPTSMIHGTPYLADFTDVARMKFPDATAAELAHMVRAGVEAAWQDGFRDSFNAEWKRRRSEAANAQWSVNSVDLQSLVEGAGIIAAQDETTKVTT